MTNRALSLFQLCDSNFPNGAFSQSFGLETYIQNDIVHDRDSFYNWLHVYVHDQMVNADGLAARLVYEALEQEDMDKVWELDHLLTVQNLAKESRDGTTRMGDRMLSIAIDIFGMDALKMYKSRIKDKLSYGHPAVVFTIVGYHLGVDKETTILYYLYSTIIGLVQNAVRAIPLGQTNGQQVIYRFQEELNRATETIMNLAEDEFGVISPGLELSQMQHEHVGIRIFSS